MTNTIRRAGSTSPAAARRAGRSRKPARAAPAHAAAASTPAHGLEHHRATHAPVALHAQHAAAQHVSTRVPAIPGVTTQPTSASDGPSAKISVFMPGQYVPAPLQAKYPNGVYLGFHNAADAITFSTQQGGVVVDHGGSVHAQQGWASAQQFVPQLRNPELQPHAVSGRFNVWFPANWTGQLGLRDATKFATSGAYLPFDSEIEAQTHVRQRGYGVLLDTHGKAAATQVWPQANGFLAQRLNDQLVAKRPAGHVSVWFPAQNVYQLGVANAATFTGGAWIAFDSEAEAQKHVQQRGMGVVLQKDGSAAATQPWGNARQFTIQLTNSKLAATRPHSYAVWFPTAMLGSVGVGNAASFAKAGAFLAFKTEAEAQAHAQQRGFGVILDPKGAPAATQTWYQANQYAAQLLNDQLTDKRTKNKFGVWFPPAFVNSLGVGNAAAFPKGAYLAFDTEADALAHAQKRGYGVVLDKKGAPSAMQSWAQARTYAAQNTELPKPPASGWLTGPKAVPAAQAAKLGTPTAGSVSIGKVSATKKGADVEIFVGNTMATDTITLSVGAQINGNWTPIYRIPDQAALQGNGWHAFTVHIDYGAVDTYLKSVNPNLKVTPNMQSAIGLEFASGHNTGIPGWSSNSGTEKDALFTLPKKSGK